MESTQRVEKSFVALYVRQNCKLIAMKSGDARVDSVGTESLTQQHTRMTS